MDDSQGYLPTVADDASRQQQAARAFYLFGDFFRGIDAVRRMEPGNVHDSGLLGPAQSGIDVGVSADGSVYERGRAGQIGYVGGTAGVAQAPAPAAGLFGIPTPLVLAGVALVALWLIKR